MPNVRIVAVRPRLHTACCPGCGREVNLVGHLELVPPHTLPEQLDYSRNADGSRRSRSRTACPWQWEPLPGRPDGHVSPDDAERLAARMTERAS